MTKRDTFRRLSGPRDQPSPFQGPAVWAAPGLAVLLIALWWVRLSLPIQAWLALWIAPHMVSPALQRLVDHVLYLLILGLGPILWVRLCDRQVSWKMVLRPVPAFGRRGPLLATVVALGYVAVVTRFHTPPTGPLAQTAADRVLAPLEPWATLLSMAAVAALEEPLFRGYLLGRLTTAFNGPVGLLGQAVPFALLHSLGWIITGSVSPDLAVLWTLGAFGFALVAGVVVRLQGGLTIAMALHCVVNLYHGGITGLP